MIIFHAKYEQISGVIRLLKVALKGGVIVIERRAQLINSVFYDN